MCVCHPPVKWLHTSPHLNLLIIVKHLKIIWLRLTEVQAIWFFHSVWDVLFATPSVPFSTSSQPNILAFNLRMMIAFYRCYYLSPLFPRRKATKRYISLPERPILLFEFRWHIRHSTRNDNFNEITWRCLWIEHKRWCLVSTKRKHLYSMAAVICDWQQRRHILINNSCGFSVQHNESFLISINLFRRL